MKIALMVLGGPGPDPRRLGDLCVGYRMIA